MQLPFYTSVGDIEPIFLRVLLRLAAGGGAHHRQLAFLLGGVLQAGGEQGVLGPAVAKLWDGRGAGQNAYVVEYAEAAGGDGFTFELGQERSAAFGSGGYFAQCKHEFAQARKLSRPACRGRFSPDISFSVVDDARRYFRIPPDRQFAAELAAHYARQFYRSVPSIAEQCQQ